MAMPTRLVKAVGGTITEVTCEPTLSPGFASASFPATDATTTKVPATLASVARLTVALAPFVREPIEQMIRPLALLQLPWLGVADKNVSDAGSVFVNTTPGA